jgi:hypothetical protein
MLDRRTFLKVGAGIAVLTAAGPLAGCSKHISGTPSQVVEECQTIETDETASVTVTGYVTIRTDSGITVGDTSTSAKPTVDCIFKDGEVPDSVGDGQRVTVTGTVEGKYVYPTYIWLHDCTVK